MLNMRQMVSRKGGADGRTAGSSQGLRVGGTVTLSFEQRRRSRLLVRLDDGREAALLLPRGTVLLDGDLLAVDGEPFVVGVRAAAQSLSIARTADPHLLTRAAYHLGNRHVPLEIGPGWLAFEHDHVLDGMVRELGLSVDTRVAPFEPEAGGYRHEHAPAGDTGHSHHV
jgi:urease accessory protein